MRTIGRILLKIIALLITVALGVVVGSAIYVIMWFGILSPIRSAEQGLDALHSALNQERDAVTAEFGARDQRLSRLQDELNEARSRLSAVETAAAQREQELADLATRLDARDEAIATLSDQVAAQIETLASLSGELGKLTPRMTALERDLDRQQDMIASIEENQSTSQDELSAQREQIEALGRLREAVLLLQAQNQVARAQLALVQRNAGVAEAHLESVAATLDRLSALLPEDDARAEQIATARERLQAALARVQGDPFVAGEELQLLWQALDDLIEVEP